MISHAKMTSEEFVDKRHEFPDAGRWHELHEGRPVMLDPPDDAHGTTVLNLAKALAEWLQMNHQDQKVGYACPDLGVKVSQTTVYFPSLSFFDSGRQFEESDNLVAQTCPRLIIDVASSTDRRENMRLRTVAYQNLGVESVWVPDPVKKEILILSQSGPTLCLGVRQTIENESALPGFKMPVPDVFAQPEWWK